MKWVNTTTFLLFVFAGFFGPSSSNCFGQDNIVGELHQRLERSPESLFQALEQWNGKKAIEKATFTEIVETDIRRIGRDQAQFWEAPRLRLWRDLPETLTPELPVTPGGQFVLLGLFQENRETFERRIDGREQQAMHVLAKTYFALSVAQSVARTRESQSIDGSHVLLATQQGSYSFWPFYCPPPDDEQ